MNFSFTYLNGFLSWYVFIVVRISLENPRIVMIYSIRAQKVIFSLPRRPIVDISYKKKKTKTHNYSLFLYNLYLSKYTISQ